MSPLFHLLFLTLMQCSSIFCLDFDVHGRSNATSSNSTTYSKLYNSTQVLVDIRESVHCYALPYGGIGCASHLLTYYCLFANSLGRKPLMPWKPHEYSYFNVLLGLLQLVGSSVASGLVISRCKGAKEMQLLGIWMILTSIAAGIASMLGPGLWIGAKKDSKHEDDNPPPYLLGEMSSPREKEKFRLKIFQSRKYKPVNPSVQVQETRNESQTAILPQPVETRSRNQGLFKFVKDSHDKARSIWGLIISWGLIGCIWLAGCAMGAYGSVLIALKTFFEVENGTVWKTTAGFFALPVFFVFIWVLSCVTATRGKDVKESASLLVFVIKLCLFFLVAMLVYMDWLLAAVTGNWWGVPMKMDREGKFLYWVYFGVKRLALLSS